MTRMQRIFRPSWALGGAVSFAALALVAGGLAVEPASNLTAEVDDDSLLRFVGPADQTRVQWSAADLLDLQVNAEIYTEDLATGRAIAQLSARLGSLERGAPALEKASWDVPAVDAELREAARRSVASGKGGDGPVLLAERLVATGSVRGGVPEYPHMAHAWRYYRLEADKLTPLSRKQWDAIVDPVEVHLSPDGNSYRYQRGRVDLDDSGEPTQKVGADTAVIGQGPLVDLAMKGRRPETKGYTPTSHLDDE